LGEGIHEGEVLTVLVAVGDAVAEGDPIMEIETDKAAVEIPCPYTGTVRTIHVKPGDLIKVGDVLMTFSNGESTPKTSPRAAAKQPTPTPAPEPRTGTASGTSGPVPASPATRRLAREKGIDLRQVPGTGPAGLVTAEDVRRFADQKPTAAVATDTPASEPVTGRPLTREAPPLPDFAKWGPVQRQPVRSIRRATAKHMALAWSQIPHVSSHDEIDIDRLEAFRQRHKAQVAEQGGRLTLTVFALKAVAAALKTYPRFNATLDTGAGEIVLKQYYHLGVAIDTDDGLIVPVMRDVDRKSITALAVELHQLVQRTRERKAGLEEMQGGTFTVTNVGHIGGSQFTPIINYPEVAILGIGGARLKPTVVEDPDQGRIIVARRMLPLVVTIDHRVLDGADAARFLKEIKRFLQDPEEMLMSIA
jgi:pyruvate dehydrogenase E2 component (dihydrolipoamide acetyltransferase)